MLTVGLPFKQVVAQTSVRIAAGKGAGFFRVRISESDSVNLPRSPPHRIGMIFALSLPFSLPFSFIHSPTLTKRLDSARPPRGCEFRCTLVETGRHEPPGTDDVRVVQTPRSPTTNSERMRAYWCGLFGLFPALKI